MSDNVEIEKSESVNPKTGISGLLTEVGQPYIIDGVRYIKDQQKEQLNYPQAFCTFKEMYNTEPAIRVSVDYTNNLRLEALDKGSVKGTGSKVSETAAKFLNYTLRNMSFGTWREAMASGNTDLVYGFSLLNVVLEKRDYGKYKGSVVLKKLAPRTQSSVYGWVFDKNNRDLKGVVQKPLKVKNRETTISDFVNSGISYNDIDFNNNIHRATKYTYIDSSRLLHFRFNPVDGNPQGSSPLIPCWSPYAEKKLIEKYEIRGISKDLSGSAVVSAPADVINKGQNPEEFPQEAAALDALIENAINMQSGESPVILLASDTDVNKNKAFDISFKGIDGGGKQYKTSEVIDQKRKDIHNVFGTAFLLLGQSGHGSNAMSSNQMSTFDYYVNNAVAWTVDVINTRLIPMLLAKNGIELDWEDMPRFVAADPSKPDLEVLSKVFNRLSSGATLTYEAWEELYIMMGLSIEGIRDMELPSAGSGSSEGAGNGSSQKNGMGSDTNNENAS